MLGWSIEKKFYIGILSSIEIESCTNKVNQKQNTNFMPHNDVFLLMIFRNDIKISL